MMALLVIDQADTVTWISNSRFHTWVGIGCEDPTMNSCTGFASGMKTASIEIDILDSTQSTLGPIIILGQLDGDLIGDNTAAEFLNHNLAGTAWNGKMESIYRRCIFDVFKR